MKILVPVKRVVDYRVKIRVKADGAGVVTEHVKMAMNPFDEIALEEAIRLKEKQIAQEVIAVAIGDKNSQETLRAALALGADQAILIETDQTLLPRAIAKILQKVVIQQAAPLVLMGKQAIDGDYNQTGQMLAARLQWGVATFASEIIFNAQTVQVTREVDAGLETIELTLPAVITCDLRLNQPRMASLPNIMQAKQKTITVIPLSELGIDTRAQSQTLNVAAPKLREGGKIVENIGTLVNILKQEKIIL